MGLLNRLLGRDGPAEVLRLDITMRFKPLTDERTAAISWVPLRFYDPALAPFLVALLYARVLIIHEETRSELFARVVEAARTVALSKGESLFDFGSWVTSFAGIQVSLWPWTFKRDARSLTGARVYRATLLGLQAADGTGRFGLNLKLAVGQENVLVPSAALVAITGYGNAVDTGTRLELARLLWRMNEAYGSPQSVRVGSDSWALHAAIEALRVDNGATS